MIENDWNTQSDGSECKHQSDLCMLNHIYKHSNLSALNTSSNLMSLHPDLQVEARSARKAFCSESRATEEIRQIVCVSKCMK